MQPYDGLELGSLPEPSAGESTWRPDVPAVGDCVVPGVAQTLGP